MQLGVHLVHNATPFTMTEIYAQPLKQDHQVIMLTHSML